MAVLFAAGLFIVKQMKAPSERDQVEAAVERILKAIAYDQQLKPFQVNGRINTLEDAIVFNIMGKVIDGEKVKTYNNREHIRSNALPAALYFTSIDISRSNTLIMVNGNDAKVSFQAVVIGHRAGNREFKELIGVNATFNKGAEGRDVWLLTAATLERQTPQ